MNRDRGQVARYRSRKGALLTATEVAELSEEAIEAIATRTVALLRGETTASAPALIDAAEVARRLGVSARWVRDNADRLRAIRLGPGARGPLRFDPAVVAERLASCSADRGSRTEAGPVAQRNQAHRRARATGTGAPLLPVKGDPQQDRGHD